MNQCSGQPGSPSVPTIAVLHLPACCREASRRFGSSRCPVPASYVATTLPGVWFLPGIVRWCERLEKVREWWESLFCPAPPHLLPLCEQSLHSRSPIQQLALAVRWRHTRLGSACVLFQPASCFSLRVLHRADKGRPVHTRDSVVRGLATGVAVPEGHLCVQWTPRASPVSVLVPWLAVSVL